jgi:hypothetical protein
MDYTEIIRDAFGYTRQGVFGNGGRWARMILALILLAIPMNGYMMRVYRGAETAPEVDQWGRLFIDGLKLMVIALVYSIPIIILWLATYGPLMAVVLSGQVEAAMASSWEPNIALMLLMYLVEFIIALVLPVVSIRFARTGRFSDAFRFKEIGEHIGKVGWINYVIGIVLVAIIVAVPVMVLFTVILILSIVLAVAMGFGFFPLFGVIILVSVLFFLILSPLFMVFQARCWTRIYDSTTATAVTG